MYTARYKFEIEKMPFSSPTRTAVLNAKFRFGNEVSSEDRQKIRANYTTSAMVVYFGNVEKVMEHGITRPEDKQMYSDDKRTIEIYPGSMVLGFDIRVTSKGNIPLEQILNLDALNQFVLTGRIDSPVVKGEK